MRHSLAQNTPTYLFLWRFVSLNELELTLIREFAISNLIRLANKHLSLSRIVKVCIQAKRPIGPALISGLLILTCRVCELMNLVPRLSNARWCIQAGKSQETGFNYPGEEYQATS